MPRSRAAAQLAADQKLDPAVRKQLMAQLAELHRQAAIAGLQTKTTIAGVLLVLGLAELVDTLHASVAQSALRWCGQNDVDDTRQIVLGGDDTVAAFLLATGVKAGGVKEKILRGRLKLLGAAIPGLV